MPNLSVMIKPASSNCNLRCEYCFYHALARARACFDYGVMSRETTEQTVRKALEYAAGGDVYFVFQGGEPLLAGLEYFETFTECIARYNTDNCKICYSLQTNGTLVDRTWTAFFVEHGFLIGLSLDGDFDANRYRVDAAGRNAHPDILRAAQYLTDGGVPFNIVVVATGYVARHAERVYRYLTAECGFRYLQFIPCLRPSGDDREDEMYMTVDAYGDFLIRLFRLYIADWMAGRYVSVRLFDNWVRLRRGQGYEQCGVSGRCARQFVIEAGGNVYPCDFYCLDEWLLGNICDSDFAELANSENAVRFARTAPSAPPRCRACEYYPICRAGGCRRYREDRDYCAAYKRFFAASMPLFDALG